MSVRGPAAGPFFKFKNGNPSTRVPLHPESGQHFKHCVSQKTTSLDTASESEWQQQQPTQV